MKEFELGAEEDKEKEEGGDGLGEEVNKLKEPETLLEVGELEGESIGFLLKEFDDSEEFNFLPLLMNEDLRKNLLTLLGSSCKNFLKYTLSVTFGNRAT